MASVLQAPGRRTLAPGCHLVLTQSPGAGRCSPPPHKLCVSCPLPFYPPAAFPLLFPRRRHLVCFTQAELMAPETQHTSLWECLQGSQSILTKPAASSPPSKRNQTSMSVGILTAEPGQHPAVLTQQPGTVRWAAPKGRKRGLWRGSRPHYKRHMHVNT